VCEKPSKAREGLRRNSSSKFSKSGISLTPNNVKFLAKLIPLPVLRRRFLVIALISNSKNQKLRMSANISSILA
jgi:hypothetical protein